MVSRRTRLILLVVLMLHAPGLAGAQETGGDPPPESSGSFYISLDISAGKPNDPQAPGVYEADLGMEAGLRLGLGYAFDSLRAEVQLGYESFGLNGVRPLPGSPLSGIDSAGDLSGMVMMGALFYELGAPGNTRPFLGAGIGFARLEADYHGRVCFLFTCSDGEQIVEGSDTVAAWQAMAGFSSPNAAGNAEWFIGYRYFETANLGLNVVGLGKVTQEGVQSHSLMLGIRFRFQPDWP